MGLLLQHGHCLLATNQDKVQLHLSFSALIQESKPLVGFEPRDLPLTERVLCQLS